MDGSIIAGNGKQLKSKTALADAGVQAMFEGWMNDAATASPDQTGSYLQAASGVEDSNDRKRVNGCLFC